MNIIHKISLDMQQNGLRQTLHVKQGDSMSRTASLTLYDNGTAWPVPSDATILQIAYYKPDRTGGLYDTMPDGSTACSAAGNVVTAKLHPQMFTAAGLVACELRLLNANGGQVSTFSWYMIVDAAVTNSIASEDYFKFATLSGLQEQLGDLSGLMTQDKTSLVAAVNAALTASVRKVNGKEPNASGAVTVSPNDIGAVVQNIQYQGTLAGALEAIAQETAKAVRSVNGVEPEDGALTIGTDDIGAAVAALSMSGTLEQVLESIAEEAMRTYRDKTNAFAAWLPEHVSSAPVDYVKTLPDGDYRIVSADSEHILHKFTSLGRSWITERMHEDDGIFYYNLYFNDVLLLQYDSSTGVTFNTGGSDGATISGLAQPKTDSDAANKAYVDKTLQAATGEIWDYLSLDLEDAPNFWERVQHLVRAGKAAALFPVGYEFTTTDADTGAKIAWVVRGHDHHKPADNALQHSMTLETKYVYSDANGAYKGLQFDAPEALYYAENGLAPGTYHFTVANQNWYADDNGKTFQFTLTQEVPQGGQVYLSMTYNATLAGKSVRTYASASATDAIETATLTEGAEGTSLGTTNGIGNINHMHRIALGSNNYAQSAARQWLNSDASAGSVWTPQTKYDRAPSWATAYNGLMHGLPADFLSVVAPAVIPCQANSIYECASLDGTTFAVDQEYNLTDKFFLLSRPEVYGLSDSTTIKDGELLNYYDGLTNPERKKYDNGGTGRRAWLRSPYPAHATTERIVDLDGSGNINTASSSLGVAPACIIA